MVETNKIKDLSLGKKIKKIRIEKKITQQELVGDYITRNMLSQIENDIATPSIKTLQYIADHLEVPLSFLMVGEHDEKFNKNYEYDDEETIRKKAKEIYFSGDYLKYIEIYENNPKVMDENKDSSMLLGFAFLEAAHESFLNGRVDKCIEYCKKAEKSAYMMDKLSPGKQIKQQAELYGFLCSPILTESGREYKTQYQNGPNEINSDNFIKRTFDINGICRQNITKAYRSIEKGEFKKALDYLLETEPHVEKFKNHPYKKDMYKLFETVYVKNEDYKNAHLYSSKILDLYNDMVNL